MNWIISSSPFSGAVVVAGSAALFLAVWMAMRLREYRRAEVVGDFNDGRCGRDFLLRQGGFLEGLMSEADFDFLASQPGYKREIGKKLRRQREKIFRLYLRELAQEFHRIHAQAREMVASSSEQYAPVVGVLMRQQVTFWRAITRIEISLAFPRVSSRRADRVRRDALAGLLETLDAMRGDRGQWSVAAS